MLIFDLAWFRPSYSTGPSICTYMKKHGSNDGSHLRMRIKGKVIVEMCAVGSIEMVELDGAIMG